MFQLDRSDAFHARVADRLGKELVGWLTTVGANGVPQPSLVWFLWDGGDTIRIFSQDVQKVRNIRRNPGVAFSLNSDEHGADMVVLTGTATAGGDHPAANEIPAYLEKYADGIASFGADPDGFAADYHVPVIITIEKLRGF